MKKIGLFIALMAAPFFVSTSFAQTDSKKSKEISKDEDVSIEIKNGDIYIDGKKIVESESEKDKDGKIVKKKIIINGKELNEDEMQEFEQGNGFFGFDGGENKPMLGVSTKESKNNEGAQVESVVPNSPAQKIGLQQGDIITRVNNKNILNPKDLVDAIGSFKPGEEVEITYERDNKFLTKNVVLSEKKDATTFRGTLPFNGDLFSQFERGDNPFGMNPYKMNPYMNNNPKIGVSVEDQENGEGVLVQDVTNNSAAQKAGILKNDVITTFNSKAISNVDDLLEAIAEAKSKDKVNIDILRNGSKKQLNLNMPKNLKKRDL